MSFPEILVLDEFWKDILYCHNQEGPNLHNKPAIN